MSSSNNDGLVDSYLRKRGYTDISKEKSGESENLDTFIFDACLDQSSERTISTFNPKESISPRVVEESYQKLKEWSENSLDLYKSELKLPLYPLFVHIFLDLLSRGFSQEAQKFMDSNKSDFIEDYPDVAHLSSLNSPLHLAESQFASMYRGNKYSLTMSLYSFELLIAFLQDNKFMALLKFINQYLNIKIVSAQPNNGVIGITGNTCAQISSINQTPIFPGASFPDPVFKEVVEAKIKMDAEKDPSSVPNHLLEAFKKYSEEHYAKEYPEPDDLIPIPPKTNADVMREIQEIIDLRDRVRLGGTALPSILTYTFHNSYSMINDISFSNDFQLIAASFSDSYIKIFSLTDKKLRSLKGSTTFKAEDFENVEQEGKGREKEGSMFKKLIGHSGPVFSTAFSPDSRYLISGSEDGSARLWSLDTFTNLVAFKGHHYPIWDVDFGPNGYYFATASHDRTAKIWSCDNIQPHRILSGHIGDVELIKFHPNSAYVVTSSNIVLRLWDIHRGKCIRIFTSGHPTSTSSITSIAISKDGHRLASGGSDGSVVVWDLASGKMLYCFTNIKSNTFNQIITGSIYSLDFSACGTVVAVGSADGFVGILSVSTSESKSKNVEDNAANSGLTSEPIVNDDDERGHSLYQTKRTPLFKVKFTSKNLLVTAGVFMPYNDQN
jgi:transcription initiation factor TFIID subunit 5